MQTEVLGKKKDPYPHSNLLMRPGWGQGEAEGKLSLALSNKCLVLKGQLGCIFLSVFQSCLFSLSITCPELRDNRLTHNTCSVDHSHYSFNCLQTSIILCLPRFITHLCLFPAPSSLYSSFWSDDLKHETEIVFLQ